MAPTTRAENRNKHPGYIDLSKPPRSTQLPSKAKSQLERDTIVNDIAALKGQLRTKQQLSMKLAYQPPGPSQEKQSRSQSVHRQDSSGQQGMSHFTHPLTKY